MKSLIMRFQAYFVYIVFLFINLKTIVGNSDEHHYDFYQDPVANVYQSREQDMKQRTSQSERSLGCPYRCHCKSNATHDVISVDCSNNGLTEVPGLPETTVQLSLRNNSISNISCESFKFLPNLEILNLASNKIKHLSPCVFQSQSAALINLTISHNKIEVLDVNLFQNLSYLQNLDLSYNFITNLVSRTFSDLVHLVSLNLSFNFIKSIAPDVFNGLYSLKTLSLLNNRLDRNDSFHKDVFQDLGALEVLNVKANLGRIDEAVSSLRNLTHLYMTVYKNYDDDVLGPGFRQLTNLRVLNLNSVAFRITKVYKPFATCDLLKTPSTFFDNIRTKNDFELYMAACRVKMKGNDSYFFPSTLVILNLHSSGVPGNKSLSLGWTANLVNTKIKYLDLSWNFFSGDDNYITDSCFEYLSKTHIKTLVLQQNDIDCIDTMYNFPTTIEKLDISYNCLPLVSLYDTFVYSYQSDFKLRELIANKQTFPCFSDGADKHILQQTLDAKIIGDVNESNTQFKSTDGAERWSSVIQFPGSVSQNILNRSLSLGKNVNSHHAALADAELSKGVNMKPQNCPVLLEDEDLDIQIICLPPDLEAVYANSGLASFQFDSVPHIRIYNNSVLRRLELPNNLLITLLGPVENVPSLQYLDLSNNQCRNLGIDFFKYMVSLQTLILNENYIGPSLTDDVNGLTFSTLTKLKLLNVSHNDIKDLSKSAFINNKNLETLDLSKNQLSEFQPSLSPILNMSFLSLSGNLLRGLSEHTINEMKLLKSRNKHFIINVLDNRLLFTCDYLPFLYLIVSEPQIFFRVEDLEFKSTNGTKLSYKDLAHQFPPLARECLAQRFFILILIIFFIVVSAVTICAVIYHKRWKLRYLYYIGRRRMHIGEHVVDYAPNADVFITYDQDDFHWRGFMQQTFLPGLNQRDITYILGETDFPGGDLMAHVTGAVVGTRKTVVLLSVDIFDDHHREYEMNLSIMREMDTRSMKIVPIFVEEVDLSVYPREIELFLRHQWERCLRYRDTDDFWSGFLDAVRENN